MMTFTMLQAAGVLAIFSALGHGFLGDKTVREIDIEPRNLKNFIRLCFLFGTLGWVAGGVIFLTMPLFSSTEALVLVAIIGPIYGFGALVNFWFTRGRHLGWVMLTVVVGLAVLGIQKGV